ncbi:BTAD domain-containing putative transcriptional regulator [Streptomyces sp. NPDC058664]|uniref:BTAD domain-containing putative transcriptional regulator n=1 Tax=unclassified Streptomyces TaxID=2593676 RepID=UPI00365B12F0
MRYQVLGPVEVLDADGGLIQIGGPKQRALLGLLIAAGGRPVPVTHLIDELWGDSPPPKVLTSLQTYVANLRKVLEPDRPARAPARVLTTRPSGYALSALAVDCTEFEKLTATAQEALLTDPSRARELLRAAASLWRGEPYADVVAVAPGLAAEAARLNEVRMLATEDRLRAELALGFHAQIVGETEQLVAVHPLRETCWGLLVLALYRSQRQAEALEALRRARRILADELGVEPGPELRQLEKAVLNHEPSLEASHALNTVPVSAVSSGSPTMARTSLVGRDDWLAQLTSLLIDAAAGHGTAVLVTGEPGIGKTRLARTLTATAEAMGIRTGWGRCEESSGAPALWSWTQALGSLPHLSDAAARLPSLKVLLAESPNLSADTTGIDIDTATFRLAEAVGTLLRESGPHLLVLDDVHWADGDTLRLLGRLATMLHRLPAVVLLTCRDAEFDRTQPLDDALADLSRTDVFRIPLRGLNQQDVSAYARQLYGVEISDDMAGALWQRTSGNPFFLGELVRLVADQGHLSEPGIAALRVPDGVRDVVRQRISRLPKDVATLLSTAAACGRMFERRLVEAASGLGAEAAAIATETALSAGLIVQEGAKHRFAHALVREAVYAQLLPQRLNHLHASIAREIETLHAATLEARTAELAYHYGKAGTAHAREGWTYAAQASVLAARRSAPAEALRLQESALSALAFDKSATPSDRYSLLVGLALARKRAGLEQEAWQAALEAADVALTTDDMVAAAEAAITTTAGALWSWREYQVVDHAGVALFERLLQELPTNQQATRAHLMAALAAEIYYAPDSTERAVTLSTEAIRLARSHGSRADLARVLELRHVAYERPPLLSERLATSRELVDIASHTDDISLAHALVFRGRDLIEQGNLSAGLRDYQKARDLAEAHAIIPVSVALRWADAAVAAARGEFARAEQLISDAREFHRNTTVPGFAEVPLMLEATLQLTQKTLPRIEPVLAHAASSTGLVQLHEWRALALLQAGHTSQARAVLGPWQEQPDLPEDFMWLAHMAIRAELWSALAPANLARDLSQLLAPYADRIAIGGTGVTLAGFTGHYIGILARAYGDLGTAVSQLGDAMQRNEEAGLWPFAAASARELAVSLRQRAKPGDETRAMTLITHALALTNMARDLQSETPIRP